MARPARYEPLSDKIDRDWWRGAMIYQVYVRSFRDTNGDGIGDLRGVLEGLDHIAGLGVDAIWLSPFYKSPQKDFGYDITDFRLVDPTAGTMDDFMSLLQAAHERGLKLLLDFIPCHTSDEHPWFRESRQSCDNPKADWYVWADKARDGCAPNNWLSSFGGPAWEWEPRRAQYYYHPFLKEQPALNLHNPEVMDHLLAEMRFWTDLGIDGFRIDAAQCVSWDRDLRSNPPVGREGSNALIGGGPTNPFGAQHHIFDRHAEGSDDIFRRLRTFAEAEDVVLIGEIADIDTIRHASDFTQEGERLHAVYDFGLINCRPDVDAITGQLHRREEFLGNGWLYNVFTNHDSTRAVSNLTHFAIGEHRVAAAKMLLFMQMTLKGGGVIFQGEELGLPHPKLAYEDMVDPWAKAFWPTFEGRDGARTPFPWTDEEPYGGFSTVKPWLPMPAEHLPLSVARQDGQEGSVMQFLADFTKWRKDSDLLRLGTEAMSQGERAPIISWRRRHEEEEMRFLVNFSTDTAFMPLDAEWHLVPAPGCVTTRGDHGVSLDALQFAIARREPGTDPEADRSDHATKEGIMSDDKPKDVPTKDDVRPAGPGQMKNPPETWKKEDEESDESFPASDPPANY
ncbi:alpha-amylase family glycosyl hydrolase [Falsirhodobacter algicola]|uniref:Alpha-glucosidase n=1 Tax=Falsirhodobacter algicola TaxID=2692330 RepID=A0A8J8SKL3_9RHOB|nr:alpha-amylase family glycosyl hydrolase [Falsirhodobacter algicola]QUS35488.1 alpha-glucosidase [Falsirhodobacter algicola]